MAPSDAYAVRLLEALAAEGIEVPGRLSVTGYDSVGYTTPLIGLATWKQPLETIGARAVDAVVRLFDAVYNSGIVKLGDGYVYDVHHLADGSTPNARFVELAAAVDAAVAPLDTPAPNPEPHRFDRDRFRAHLSLASHDLLVRPDLTEEVGEYLRALPFTPPPQFVGDTVALYRTSSADWSGRWWTTLTWEHIHTWRLPA
jgi:hypothetical protein